MFQPSHPDPPTRADLDASSPAECLAALREEFDAAHNRHPQYAGWTAGTTLGVVRHRIGHTFARAERGDLVLLKRGPREGLLAGIDPLDVAYMPRVGWVAVVALGDVEDIEDIAVQETLDVQDEDPYA